MAAMGNWKRGADQYSGSDEGGVPPTETLGERNMTVLMGDIGYEKPISSSQTGPVDSHPDITPTDTRTHTLEGFSKARLGSSCLSLRDRLLHEVRDRVRGWPCHICHQRFKRRDYVKQHMKKRHPEHCDSLLYTQSSISDRSVATPASSRSIDADPLAFGLLEDEKSRYPMVFWNGQSDDQITNSFQSGNAFPGSGITHQKMSLDLTAPDGRDFSGASENASSPCVKTGHDNSARLFACPF